MPHAKDHKARTRQRIVRSAQRLVKTASHGHTRILASPELVDIVARRIGADHPSSAQPVFQADTSNA